MALSDGQKLALYLLMGTHSDTPDGKSAFRAYVEKNGSPGYYTAPFVEAAQQLDSNIASTDINQLPSLDPVTLRAALGMADYPGTSSPCPAFGDEQTIYAAQTTYKVPPK
jgi:hypothetical protein